MKHLILFLIIILSVFNINKTLGQQDCYETLKIFQQFYSINTLIINKQQEKILYQDSLILEYKNKISLKDSLITYHSKYVALNQQKVDYLEQNNNLLKQNISYYKELQVSYDDYINNLKNMNNNTGFFNSKGFWFGTGIVFSFSAILIANKIL